MGQWFFISLFCLQTLTLYSAEDVTKLHYSDEQTIQFFLEKSNLSNFVQCLEDTYSPYQKYTNIQNQPKNQSLEEQKTSFEDPVIAYTVQFFLSLESAYSIFKQEVSPKEDQEIEYFNTTYEKNFFKDCFCAPLVCILHKMLNDLEIKTLDDDLKLHAKHVYTLYMYYTLIATCIRQEVEFIRKIFIIKKPYESIPKNKTILELFWTNLINKFRIESHVDEITNKKLKNLYINFTNKVINLTGDEKFFQSIFTKSTKEALIEKINATIKIQQYKKSPERMRKSIKAAGLPPI